MLELYRTLLSTGDVVAAVDAANHALHHADEALAFTSAARLATMTTIDSYLKTLGPDGFETIVPLLEVASKLPQYAGKDVSESTWRAKYEAAAQRHVEKIWSEWFPAYVQGRSAAYQLDWTALTQEFFGQS